MSERLAMLDLGSNAVRFVLARLTPGVEFRVLREDRVQTRLGGGHGGRLSRTAVEQTLEALHDFLVEVRTGGAPRVVAVATAAVRDAPNSDRLPVAPSPLPHAALAVVHIPTPVVPRFVPLPAGEGEHAFILLENVIRM